MSQAAGVPYVLVKKLPDEAFTGIFPGPVPVTQAGKKYP
jgi:hypothetical protein